MNARTAPRRLAPFTAAVVSSLLVTALGLGAASARRPGPRAKAPTRATPGPMLERFLAGRAKATGVALVSANRSVRRRPSTWRGYGNSCVLAPDGRVLGRAVGRLGSEIVYARVPVKP